MKPFHRRSFVCVLAALGLLSASTATAGAATLRPVSLEAPGAKAFVEASPTFTWRPLSGAATYEFQIASDRLFGSISQTIRTANTAATLKGTVTDGTYYWRVRAVTVKNKVGRWSSTRELQKRWRTAPELLEPTADFGAVWPSVPLVLRWSAVPHATDYIVVVATDPSLAQPVLGTVQDPQVTQGTVLAFPGTLNAGTYYWQITPRDSDGHRGAPSAVGRFSWSWPSALTPTVTFPNPAREVSDPLLSWTPVAGAAGYDVEINTTPEFAAGSKFFSTTIAGTAVAPVKPVPNGDYYWRVRAVDAGERAGSFYTGTFRKAFDDAVNFTPPRDTITGLKLRDGVTGNELALGNVASAPTLTWDPVPGAAEYEVHAVSKDGPVCNWTGGFVSPHDDYIREKVHNPSFGLRKPWFTTEKIGSSIWPYVSEPYYPFDDGVSYCVRVLARDGSGVALTSGLNDSEFTYLGGTGQSNTTAFIFSAAPVTPEPACSVLAAPTYVSPAFGSVLSRSPSFRWDAVPNAKSYYVVVARDSTFTEIVEVVRTDQPFYIPALTDHNPANRRDTYEDTGTNYYWQVLPSPRSDGGCAPTNSPPYQRFAKRSEPPILLTPGDGATQADQSVFSWTAAEGAASYRIQVARDVEFRDLLEDETTRSTSFAAATTYPVDTQLYWRVRARDANDIDLNYSVPRSFRRTLPAPVVDATNATAGGTIPVMTWQPVQGATSYSFHVDKVDGKTEDFTVGTPRFTPTEFYGNGTWRWKVSANFPRNDSGEVSGPYSEAREFTRRILAPESPRAVNIAKRVVFSWNPDGAGKKYKLETARDDSFEDVIETVITPNTSYAPLLTNRGYSDGGRLYWRVAVQDSGNNVGAFSRGDLRRAARLILATKVRSIQRGKRSTVVITVTDPRGTKQRGVKVSVAGLGMKGSKKTGERGTARFRLRPKKRGTITFKASRKGYVTGSLTLRAY